MRLKETPEDFVVDEIATDGFVRSIEPHRDHPYLVVRVSKRDCAHFDLTRSVSRRFSIPESDLGIGGIKDRRAVTSQFVTLPNRERISSAFSDSSVIPIATDTGVATLELLGSSLRRMTIGAIFGNRFSIRAIVSEDERLGLDRIPRSVRVPNYFGSQRFGRNAENVALGYALVSGDFAFVRDTLLSRSSDDPLSFVRRISRKKRMLYVSAFQSAIFNAELVDRFRGGVLDSLEDPISGLTHVAMDRVYGECDFSDDIPIVSLGSPLTSFQESVLEKLSLSPRSFAIRQLPDIMFEPVVRASSIEVSFTSFELDKDLRVSFELPKGSYATVVLESVSSMASRISAKTSSGD